MELINFLFLMLLALLLTIAVELLVAFFLGFRKKEELYAIIAINLITNPVLNFLIQLNYQLNIISSSFELIIVLEVIVVIVEFLLLFFMLRQDKKKLFIVSLLINLASFLFGLLILKG